MKMKVWGDSGLILLCARELSGILKLAPLRWNLLQFAHSAKTSANSRRNEGQKPERGGGLTLSRIKTRQMRIGRSWVALDWRARRSEVAVAVQMRHRTPGGELKWTLLLKYVIFRELSLKSLQKLMFWYGSFTSLLTFFNSLFELKKNNRAKVKYLLFISSKLWV